MAKANNTAKAEETKDQAPEMDPKETKETKAPEGGAQKEEKANNTAKAEKVYKFTTCSAVGVQFIDGKAETKSLEVAKVLATLDGVTLIEE